MLTKQKLWNIRQLFQKKYREASGKFIIEGWKSVDEAVNAGIEIETIVYDEQKIDSTQLISTLERSAKEIFPAKAKDIDSISDTVTSQGIIAVLPKFSSPDKLNSVLQQQTALIVALDGINDPGNLGTIIRTCDWFGVDALVIGKNSVELYNPKVVRATMGSLFHFPVIDEIDLVSFLKQSRKENFSIYSTELTDSEDVRKISFSKKSVLVIGSESHGVSKEISVFADKKILIPQFGKAESLNVAMACGIILARITLK